MSDESRRRVSARFEELDWQPTPMGEISLRRRWDPVAEKEAYEIKLDDEFLMSSLFTTAEVKLAELALAGSSGVPLDVVVGGLGLGYTAQAVLDHPDVRSLVVVEALGEVIGWHQDGLLPIGPALRGDSRCRLVHGDFFAMLASPGGLDLTDPGRRFHAIIVDIDHSPRHLLHSGHGWFYQPAGLRHAAAVLHPGGRFALWSNDPPDDGFLAALAEVFTDVAAEPIRFRNPYQERLATNSIYLARARPAIDALGVDDRARAHRPPAGAAEQSPR